MLNMQKLSCIYFFHQTLNTEHVSKFLKRDKKEGKIISELKKTLRILVVWCLEEAPRG